MKKGKVEIEKTELKTEFSVYKTEPHWRPHLYSEKSRKPVLLCPVPFLNQIPWEPKVYLPANATEPPSKRQDLFYALFDEKRYREAIKPYLSEPQTWDDSIHPFYKEPDCQDELSLWTKGMEWSPCPACCILATPPDTANYPSTVVQRRTGWCPS
jgi:hypothetical protein